ncbi:tyrosine-type recombinase/integrase [Candidatus Protochlamydia phocaeensis]|uniref:tyrosine-type recombinase/integrase n=1 Tax=Candidatus Protochlamydia phocaeensis TaxID=1414722 RepID=UPI0009AD5A00|nr:site-specific integrase [Candidatus Protochlamydia phocaeensis]
MTIIHQDVIPSGYKELIPSLNPSTFTYAQVKHLREEAIWNNLDRVNLSQALSAWYDSMSSLTALNYQSGMRKLVEFGFLNPFMSLQQFSQLNHNAIIDRIKKDKSIQWSECSRQARAAAFISFTSYLCRQTDGLIKKALPNREEANKTFKRVHKHVVTEAMTQAQWLRFFEALDKINSRDCLLAKIALQGGKRIGEVLSLTVDKIDWNTNQITFKQLKTRGAIEETIITYPPSVMNALKIYISDRQGLVFITRTGKPIPLCQLASTFEKAGKAANIPFKVTPHVLRASTVTYLKQQGFSDSDIQKVTGHASSEMINAYDKSSRADNASKKVSLV